MFLHLGTWNVNARRPSNESVLPWLTFDSGESPDIFALSFQEIVELSAKQVWRPAPCIPTPRQGRG